MKLNLKEAITSARLKSIGKKLRALGRRDRTVKPLVDKLEAGEMPTRQEIMRLKGDPQDEVVMAFAEVIGPGETMKVIGMRVDEAKKLEKDKDDPCWDGYVQLGTKKKNGKEVPNCVPKESVAEASPMIAPPTNEFSDKKDAFDYKRKHGGKVMKHVWINPRTGRKSTWFKVVKESVAEQFTSDIKKQYDSMKKMSTSALKDLYKRHHRVSDPKGLSKSNLIFDILRAEHGNKRVAAALGLKESIKQTLLDMLLDEAVRVDDQRFVRSHGKKPKGRGNWAFTTKDFDDPKDKDIFRAPALTDYTKAQALAKKWAKDQGVGVGGVVYTMESVELDEAVRVDRKKYSWGQMITVYDGKANSFPLHPEHQKKIKNLNDGQKTVFKDETGATITAHRKGDQIHLSNKMSSRKVPVDYSVFAESVELSESISPRDISVGDNIQFTHPRTKQRLTGRVMKKPLPTMLTVQWSGGKIDLDATKFGASGPKIELVKENISENIHVSFRSIAAKNKWMRLQSLKPTDGSIVKSDKTSLVLTKDMKQYADPKKHADLIYSVKEETISESSLVKVDVEGLPTFYMDVSSAAEAKRELRKLLKKSSDIVNVKRVPKAFMKKDLRNRLTGKDITSDEE